MVKDQSKKIGKCSYHLCDEKQVEVYKCKYCNEYFCKDHVKAKKPMAAPFKSTDVVRQMEWKDKSGHPCVRYLEHVIQKEKEQKSVLRRGIPISTPNIAKSDLQTTDITDKPIDEIELENTKPEESKSKKEEKIPDKIKFVTCDKCGKKITEKETRKTYSTKDGDVITCPSCYSFGNKDTNKSTDKKQETKPVKKHKEKNYLKKVKDFFSSNKKPLYKHPNKIISWFFSKKKPWSKLRYGEFGIHLTVLICSLFLFMMIQSNLGQLNELKLLFIKTGSLVLLILFFVIHWAIYRLLKNLKFGIRGMANGYKTIASIVVILFCFYLFLHPSIAINPITSFDYDSLNPLELNLNFTSNSDSYDSDYYPDYNDQTDVISAEELRTGEKNVTLTYYLHGTKYDFEYTVYQGINDYLADLPRSISYYDDPPTTKDFIMMDLDQEQQRVFLLELVEKIESITDNQDDQARIAISIVQNIPYEWSSLYLIFDSGEFPYEVLYTQSGVCGEKSDLLAFILRDLGFGVAVFEFEEDSHRSVGLKCSSQYDYRDSGYCFVESTTPTIISDSEGDYVGVGKLSSHELIVISDGVSFDSVSEEYADAQEFNQLNDKSASSGGVLSQYDYNRWMNLVNKYGIIVG